LFANEVGNGLVQSFCDQCPIQDILRDADKTYPPDCESQEKSYYDVVSKTQFWRFYFNSHFLLFSIKVNE